MTNPPSKPSYPSKQPSGSGFRTAIFFVLGSVAVSGLGGYLLGKFSNEKADKSEITDVIKVVDSSSKSIQSGDGERLDFPQCRNLILTIGNPKCRRLSKDELKKRYLAEHQKGLEKKADALVGQLGIYNPDDINKIYKAMLNGCTAVKTIEGKTITLQPPPAINNCDNPIFLNQEPDKNLVDNGEFIDYEKMLSGLSSEEREMMEAYRDKNYDELFKKANFKDIKSQIDLLDRGDFEFSRLGIGKSINNTFKSLEEARDEILKTKNTAERQRIICELILKMNSQKFTNEQSKKLTELQERGINLDFDDSVQFYAFWHGLLAMSGFNTSESEVEEKCNQITSKTSTK